MIQTLEQKRAAHALEVVQELKREPSDEIKKRYRAYAERIGPAILMNGLGQALATERAAAASEPRTPEQEAHRQIYINMASWLRTGARIYDERIDLLESIVQGDQSTYLRAQSEALAWLVWQKKFCRAYLPAPEKEG